MTRFEYALKTKEIAEKGWINRLDSLKKQLEVN